MNFCFIVRIKWGMGTFWKCMLVKFEQSKFVLTKDLVLANTHPAHLIPTAPLYLWLWAKPMQGNQGVEWANIILIIATVILYTY